MGAKTMAEDVMKTLQECRHCTGLCKLDKSVFGKFRNDLISRNKTLRLAPNGEMLYGQRISDDEINSILTMVMHHYGDK